MQLTQADMIASGGKPFMKAWLAAMNEGPKVFKMSGPCSLPARERGGANSRSTMWNFMGGEELNIIRIFEEPNIQRSSAVIKVMFGGSEELRKVGFVNMTMPLDSAFNTVEGLQEWVNECGGKAAKTASEVAPKLKAAPKVADFRESERWGAW